MATLTLSPPSLIVEQLFARRPAGIDRPLLPYLFGPLAHLVRYGVASEKSLGYLGQYDDSPAMLDGKAQTAAVWPNLPLGATIDAGFTKLYIENALARYYQDTSLTAQRTGGNLVYSPTVRYGDSGGQLSNVLDGGVRVNDLVRIKGVKTNSDPFSLAAYVVGLKPQTVAAVVGVPAAVGTNKAPQSQTESATAGGSNTSQLAVVADGDLYDGKATGHVSETYTLTVTTAGAGGIAKLSVVSASGTDNQSQVSTTTLGSSIAIGTRGLTVTFSAAGGTTFVLGDVWTVTVTQQVIATSLNVAGAYTSTQDRTYIVEVVAGGPLSNIGTWVAVGSVDGTDTLPIQKLSGTTVNLGSYGPVVTFTATTGLVKGDKWTIGVTGIRDGESRTLILSHNLPDDVALNTASANLEIEIFRSYTGEVPSQGLVGGTYNYTVETTQLLIAGGIALRLDGVTLAGSPLDATLVSTGDFGSSVNRLYAEYRAWLAPGSDLFPIETESDIDVALSGPVDPLNPLKYAVNACRLGAVGETIYVFNTGDPSVTANWEKALQVGERSDSVYGYVPLTHDSDILALCQAAVATANSSNFNAYRVLWTSSKAATGESVLSAATTDNSLTALAVVEDDSQSSGTQYTQVRLTSGNADLLSLGVRIGDTVRYGYQVDAWGNATYQTRTISQIRSATTLLVSQPFGAAESIGKRIEIHRTYNATELRDHYSAEASRWGSDLVRYVLAPVVGIGSKEVPAYYMACIAAGMRAYYTPQQPLSTMQIPGVVSVGGLEALSVEDLNRLAADGAFICAYDYRSRAIRIRHAVTTGETEILSRREESMVSARHAALFRINSRLSIYAGQVNLGEAEDGIDALSEQIRAELESENKALQTLGYTPELGGLIRELIITNIAPSPLVEDELVIEGALVLGRPGNKIRFQVLIR